jgi:hypothetical protein
VVVALTETTQKVEDKRVVEDGLAKVLERVGHALHPTTVLGDRGPPRRTGRRRHRERTRASRLPRNWASRATQVWRAVPPSPQTTF